VPGSGRSQRGALDEIVLGIDGAQPQLARIAVAQNRDAHLGPRLAVPPDAPIQLGVRADRFAIDGGDDVAEPYAGAFRRASGQDLGDGERAAVLRSDEPQPGPARRAAVVRPREVRERRLKTLHWDEKISVREQERADSQQLPAAVHEGGAGPVAHRWGGEDRALDQIFPVARVLPDRDHLCMRNAPPTGRDGHQHRRLRPERRSGAERQRAHAERSGGTQDGDADRVVLRGHDGRHRSAIPGRNGDRVRLLHEERAGEDVTTTLHHDARALPLAALVAARVRHGGHLDRNHGGEDLPVRGPDFRGEQGTGGGGRCDGSREKKERRHWACHGRKEGKGRAPPG